MRCMRRVGGFNIAFFVALDHTVISPRKSQFGYDKRHGFVQGFDSTTSRQAGAEVLYPGAKPLLVVR
jgi:hypothetical protein